MDDKKSYNDTCFFSQRQPLNMHLFLEQNCKQVPCSLALVYLPHGLLQTQSVGGPRGLYLWPAPISLNLTLLQHTTAWSLQTAFCLSWSPAGPEGWTSGWWICSLSRKSDPTRSPSEECRFGSEHCFGLLIKRPHQEIRYWQNPRAAQCSLISVVNMEQPVKAVRPGELITHGV